MKLYILNNRITFLYIFVILQLLHSQIINQPYLNNCDLSFTKHINTWYWTGGFDLYNKNSTGLNYYIRDRFSSNLQLPVSQEQEWRDENNLSAYFYKTSNNINYGLYSTSWLLSDQLTSSSSRYSNHKLGIKADYTYNTNYIINPYLGYQRSENKSLIDYGWNLGLTGKIYDYPLGDYKSDLTLESNYDLYEDRRNNLNNITVNITTKFSEFTEDSLSIGYMRDSKQYYLQIEEDNYFLNDLLVNNRYLFNYLNYQFSDRSFFKLNTIIISKKIEDNDPYDKNERNILRIENFIYYKYLLKNMNILLGIQMHQENQDNLGIQTDNISKQTGFKSNILYNFNENNKLDFMFDYIKFQYDTPDTSTNHDDRDEQRFIGSLKYYRFFNSLLSMNVYFYSNIFHRMYILANKSLNNNWNRIFRLGSEVIYKNQGWANVLRTQILANYTAYDFEDLFPTTKSFVFRKYILSDSLTIPLHYSIHAGIHSRLELEDKGKFYKDTFAQAILQSTRSIYYDFFLHNKQIFLFDIHTGITFYKRLDWQHIPYKRIIRDIYSFTPYIRITYLLHKNLQFFTYFARTEVKDKGSKNLSYFNGRLSLHYFF